MKRLLICVHLIVAVNSITVTPLDVITQGNCSGKLDYFLCTCLSANTTIDIHLSSGHYHFTHQPCELSDKNEVTITGNDSVIECNSSGFNVVFINTVNIRISNITMKGCGGVFSNSVSHIINQTIPSAYFGNGSRFVLMFVNSNDINISNLTMFDSLGYGILSWNSWERLELSHVQIINTTFENDPNCLNETADFSCSGSGIFLMFLQNRNCTVNIDQCTFTNNKNTMPLKQLQIFSNLVSTAYYVERVPLIGAGCITLYNLQNISSVTTNIVNTMFYNNNGSYSATVAITTVYSISGNTTFENCTFLDNNRISHRMFDEEQSSYILPKRWNRVFIFVSERWYFCSFVSCC